MSAVRPWPQATKPFRVSPPEGAAGVVLPIRGDNLSFFKLAFHSLLDFTDYRYMLTIVDNMNGYATRRYLESIRRNHSVNVLQYQEAHAQGAEWNLGLRFMFSFATVHYGVVLTPDVIFEPNWLSRIVKVLNDPVQSDIVIPGSNMPPDAVPGFCMAFKRAAYESLNGFDEEFHESGPTAAEFIDRAKKAAFRPFWTTETYIHHFAKSGIRYDTDFQKADQELLKTKLTKEAVLHE